MCRKTAAALRRLADDLEHGMTVIEKVHLIGVASNDDFAVTKLILTVHEQKEKVP